MAEVLDQLNDMAQGSSVTVAWIPSHVGIHGNEAADAAAKEGLNLSDVNSTAYIEWSEMKTKIQRCILNKWQSEYTESLVEAFYKEIEPLVSTSMKYVDAPRRREVQITRLRLDKAVLNSHLHKMKRHPDGSCKECDVPDTTKQLLLDCCRKNISLTIRNKCQMLGVECTLSNIFRYQSIQHVLLDKMVEIWGEQVM